MSYQISLFSRRLSRIALLFPAMFCVFSAGAQHELMLNSLPDVWHSTSTNPAFFPETKRFYIGLPGIGLDAAHSGDITYRDVFVKDGDRTVIDFGNVISRLDDQNEAYFEQRYEVLNLGVKLPGKWVLQAGYANRLGGQIRYPKTLPQLLWLGNGAFVGQSVDIGMEIDVADWNEWSVGLAKQFGPLTLGIRGKLLTGVSALRTDPDRHAASITTSSDIYQLSMDTDFGFHSASIISSIDTNNLGFKLTLADLKRKAFSQNTGTAFDFGLNWQVSERLSIAASLLDVGAKIHWDSKANYFLSNGHFEYEGQSFPGTDIINGADSLDFQNTLDTLNDVFNFAKTPAEFDSKLNARGYLSARYELTKRWSLGLSLYYSDQGENTDAQYSFGASARWKLLRWLSLGAMYNVNDRNAANIGFHLVAKPGPMQVYFASDNLFNAFSVKNSPAVNLRAGVSLLL